MNTIRHRQQEQRGAVSLFIVVFTTLLMIIITVSFIQLMLKDQQQATVSDLSQSAYDSALAGVEDAKRLLLLDQQCRTNNPPPNVSCDDITAALGSNECNTVARILGGSATGETIVKQDDIDDDLNQAYTCVKIDPSTDDYKGSLKINESTVIPLRSTTAFDKVRISWFIQKDIGTTSQTVNFPSTGPNKVLPPINSNGSAKWAADNPALLRTQLMQTGDSFKLSDFDASNAHTLFLYPAENGSTDLSFSLDARRTPSAPPNTPPELADCKVNFAETYACSVEITLPDPVNGNAGNRSAMLRLSALYNGAHYKIEMLSSAGAIQPFDRVQSEVDSTGRASDVFRRVKSRVELRGDFTYPEAAVDIVGDLCKNFTVIDRDPTGPETFGYNTNCTQ